MNFSLYFSEGFPSLKCSTAFTDDVNSQDTAFPVLNVTLNFILY